MGFNPLDIVGSAADLAKNLLDRFWPKQMNEKERAEAELEISKMIQARDEKMATISRDVIVAELTQEDKFVKRARPMITYVGLFVIVFNYVLIPFVNRILEWIFIASKSEGVLALYSLKPVDLPEMFWVAWGGVVAVYSVGRTTELIRTNKARTQ